jgi:hypothetical protein
MSRPVFKEQLVNTALRFILVSINVFVLLLCLAVFVTGLWGRLTEENYVSITGASSLTESSLALAAMGVCVSLLALLGILGGLLLKSILGRVLLSVYAFVLLFLIVGEISAGVAAIRYRDDLEERIENSAIKSLNNTYSDNASDWNMWDHFQQQKMCCGAVNYSEYFAIFMDNDVPNSCCTPAAITAGHCSGRFISVTPANVTDIFTQPCLDVMVPSLQKTMLVLAVVSITLAVFQVSGVVLSAIAIYAEVRREDKKSKSYQKMRQRTRGSSQYYSA